MFTSLQRSAVTIAAPCQWGNKHNKACHNNDRNGSHPCVSIESLARCFRTKVFFVAPESTVLSPTLVEHFPKFFRCASECGTLPYAYKTFPKIFSLRLFSLCARRKFLKYRQKQFVVLCSIVFFVTIYQSSNIHCA